MLQNVAGRHLVTNLILLYWATFFFFFGYIHWGDFELFDKQWWFDLFGHALFGVSASINLLYLYRRYACHGAFNFIGHAFLAINIIGQVIIIGGVLWESMEASWDLLIQPWCCPHLAKAQKGALDTTLDILATMIASSCTMGIWVIYNRMYEKFFHDESIANLVDDAIERIEQLGEVVRQSHIEKLRLREINRRLFKAVRSARRHGIRKRKDI